MGTTYSELDAALVEWIARQHMWFVGTAPLARDGHVNVSPKGGAGMLRVLGPREVAYLDVAGSGAETIAHLRKNGRIVIMFCAFEGPPRVVRLDGRAGVVFPGTPSWDELASQFSPDPAVLPAIRSIVQVELDRIADSCGFLVPRMTYRGENRVYHRWVQSQTRKHGPAAAATYMDVNNATSIDGLHARDTGGSAPSTQDVRRFAHHDRRL